MTNKRQPAEPKKPARITQAHLERASAVEEAPKFMHQRYEPLPGVIPAAKVESTLAMDSTPYDIINQAHYGCDYTGFRGYPLLAQMAQQVEYSNMIQVLADEMVRNWIEVKSRKAGDPDVDAMEDLLEKYDIKRLIHEAVVQDATFGIAHTFVDVGASDTELANPLVLDPRSIKKGSLKGFRVVDPTWVYPALYNTLYPLKADFYKPQQWFVMGQTVHESRLIDMVSRPVMQILKPSYNFGGLSLVQLMEDYVRDWRDMKRNVTKLVETLRLPILMTDMDARMAEPGQFDARIKFLTQYRDNFGVLALNKDTEEYSQHQTALSDLSNLLSNYQDQLCIPARVTNLKLLGNAPAGLNASGDSELETWHETTSGMKERDIRRKLETIFRIIQLSEFGEIKKDIYFEFRPMNELSEKERAEIIKIRVETVAVAGDSMLISSEEGRDALKEIEGAGFENLPEGYVPEGGEEGLANEP